jgi:sugar (pentulose or hexulose) kinase
LPFNSLYQLLAIQKRQPDLCDRASTLLYMPDLLSYFCTGEIGTEYTIASTSQLTDPLRRDWSAPIFNAFQLPPGMFTEIREPGTVRGSLSASIREELGIASDVPVVAGAQHDTAAAVAAVPAKEKNFAYISSGTWSLLGVETGAPVVSGGVMDANYTNEGGVCNTTRVLKNIMGMWILQECRRNWQLEGSCESYQELAALAEREKPFRSVFDPDDIRFLPQGDMPARIRAYCADTGQPAPETHGQFARAIYESLALKYRWAVGRLERDILGHEISCLHIVGGGSNNALLNQMTASAVSKPVVAGPGEATAIGNLLMQAMALSEVHSLDALRDIVRASFETVEYMPENTGQWQDAYDHFLRITGLD